ncbi:hypothetical protein F751_0305 [Auxenochlorella protothecoides]|uniref:Uncharacterized protein n=1 Tax=Auxenochlorella protothecoides TaxID=3075 RepID=A0A087SS60_AUXPR|nr:hypothetical protein F751_0305 [Auxenochlorella protothecoides]KFM28564.1 hypothetical protein F751_0305 [Auxenochlorella protothecoides]
MKGSVVIVLLASLAVSHASIGPSTASGEATVEFGQARTQAISSALGTLISSTGKGTGLNATSNSTVVSISISPSASSAGVTSAGGSSDGEEISATGLASTFGLALGVGQSAVLFTNATASSDVEGPVNATAGGLVTIYNSTSGETIGFVRSEAPNNLAEGNATATGNNTLVVLSSDAVGSRSPAMVRISTVVVLLACVAAAQASLGTRKLKQSTGSSSFDALERGSATSGTISATDKFTGTTISTQAQGAQADLGAAASRANSVATTGPYKANATSATAASGFLAGAGAGTTAITTPFSALAAALGYGRAVGNGTIDGDVATNQRAESTGPGGSLALVVQGANANVDDGLAQVGGGATATVVRQVASAEGTTNATTTPFHNSTALGSADAVTAVDTANGDAKCLPFMPVLLIPLDVLQPQLLMLSPR